MNGCSNIIVIGADHYNTYGVVRSLGKAGLKTSVLIVSSTRKSFVLKSKYINFGHICSSNEDCINSLIELHNEGKRNIVIACGDDVQELLIDNYDRLYDKFILPIGDNPKLIKDLMNKDNILIWAEKYGIKIPKTVRVLNREIPVGIEYPCLTKPITSISGHKSDIVVCHNEDELKSVILDETRCANYIVQQYVDFEKEISILGAVLNNGEVVFSGCIDKLRTCMIGTSSFAVMTDNAVIGDNREKIAALLKESGYRGLFSAEFLKKGDTLYFLEINFRNDGNTYVATSSGTNLPLLYVNSFSENPIDVKSATLYPHYFMLDIEDFRTNYLFGNLTFNEWHKDFKITNCFLVYDKMDKKPFYHKLSIVICDFINELSKSLRRKVLKLIRHE